MMQINYNTVATVLETWEETRQSHENIENEFGLLTLKRYVIKSVFRPSFAVRQRTNSFVSTMG